MLVDVTHVNSYELCAGLLDKPNRTKEEAIVDEIREELGYEVTKDQLEFVGRSSSCDCFFISSSWSRRYVWVADVHVLRRGDTRTEEIQWRWIEETIT